MDEIEKLWDQRARFYDLQVFPMELMGMKRLRRLAVPCSWDTDNG